MLLNQKSLGTGYPLIILHGLFGSLDNWIKLGRMFGEEIRLFWWISEITVNLPGQTHIHILKWRNMHDRV